MRLFCMKILKQFEQLYNSNYMRLREFDYFEIF